MAYEESRVWDSFFAKNIQKGTYFQEYHTGKFYRICLSGEQYSENYLIFWGNLL